MFLSVDNMITSCMFIFHLLHESEGYIKSRYNVISFIYTIKKKNIYYKKITGISQLVFVVELKHQTDIENVVYCYSIK